jgi:signal transduction histidine kinase
MDELKVPYNDDIIVIIFAGTVLFLTLVTCIVFFVIYYQRRRQQHTLEIADMKNKYEQELLRSQLEIQEQTLRTISQEIHDNIGQVLSLAKLQLHALKGNNTEADIQPTRDLISKSINDLRDLSKSLNPDRIADIGLVESLQHEMQLLQKTHMMETFVEVKGASQAIPPEKEIIVFRIFQELMNNTIRHSQATELTLQLEYLPGLLQLTLTDNGVGFDVNSRKGIGLTSMNNRARMISAELTIESEKSKGTITRLWLPLQTEENLPG